MRAIIPFELMTVEEKKVWRDQYFSMRLMEYPYKISVQIANRALRRYLKSKGLTRQRLKQELIKRINQAYAVKKAGAAA